MQPIRFHCQATLSLPPEEIARQILDLANWPKFTGFGPTPGIRLAEFEVRTPDIVGSRIRVTNTDGSTHVEQIVEWQPDRRVKMLMHEFSAPVSRLATSFDETWDFKRLEAVTEVTRSFELHAKSSLVRPILWMIALLLKQGIRRHLRVMAAG